VPVDGIEAEAANRAHERIKRSAHVERHDRHEHAHCRRQAQHARRALTTRCSVSAEHRSSISMRAHARDGRPEETNPGHRSGLEKLHTVRELPPDEVGASGRFSVHHATSSARRLSASSVMTTSVVTWRGDQRALQQPDETCRP
jgi:hypothetical protein